MGPPTLPHQAFDIVNNLGIGMSIRSHRSIRLLARENLGSETYLAMSFY